MTNLREVDWSRLPAPMDDGTADHLDGARWLSARFHPGCRTYRSHRFVGGQCRTEAIGNAATSAT